MATKSRWWQRLRRQAWQALAEGVKAAATCRECHQMSELVCRGRRRLWPWPAFFLSLNSVGIRQIGLLMSFVCCQPEWSVGSGSLGLNWKSKRAVWLVELPSWLSSAPSSSPPASLCVTKADCLPRAVPLLPNKGAPPPECPQARWRPPPPLECAFPSPPAAAAMKAPAPPVGSSSLSIQRVRYYKFLSQCASSSSWWFFVGVKSKQIF